MSTSETLIVGGGLIGLSSALELARQGRKVRVIDAGTSRRPASLAGAGLLAPLSHKQPEGPVARAAIAARGLWGDWLRDLARDFDGPGDPKPIEYDTSGALVAAATPDEVEILHRVRNQAEELGEPNETLDASELRRLAPDLRQDIREGLLLQAEARVDNISCFGAVERTVQALGVEIIRHTRIERIARTATGIDLTTTSGRLTAGRVVLATGCWTSLLEGVGEFPVRPVRGQMIRVTGADWPWQGMIRVGNHYAVRRGPSDVLFGATVEEVGYEDHTTAEGLSSLTTAFARAFPGLAGKPLVDSWSGLRPACSDGNPIVGPWQDWPLFIATGHHRDGILFAPWTASQVGAWVASADSWQGTPEFSANRFARDSTRQAPPI